MNPGFLSYIAITLCGIFILSGWKTVVVGRIPGRSAFLFCIAWILFAAVRWKTEDVSAGTFVYLPLIVSSAILIKSVCRSVAQAVSAISFSLLLGALYSLVELMETVDPLLIVFHPLADPVVVFCVLLFFYSRNVSVQIALISLGLVVNDVYMAFLYREWEVPFFGGREFQDVWWICAAACRTMSAAATGALPILKKSSVTLSGLLRLLRLRK